MTGLPTWGMLIAPRGLGWRLADGALRQGPHRLWSRREELDLARLIEFGATWYSSRFQSDAPPQE